MSTQFDTQHNHTDDTSAYGQPAGGRRGSRQGGNGPSGYRIMVIVIGTVIAAALIVLAAVYVPSILAIGRLFGQSGDYGSVLTWAAMAWSASQLPAIAGIVVLPYELWVVIFALAILYFVVKSLLA